jgi:hypothetical protein
MLYHMPNSLEFLTLVSEKADKLFLCTHVVPDGGYPPDAVYAPAITGVEETEFRGRTYHLPPAAVRRADERPNFCGGAHGDPAWLPRGEILQALRTRGFSDLRIGFENALHENGPCFALVVHR